MQRLTPSRALLPALLAVAAFGLAWPLSAAEVTLKVHHFLPPPSVAHARFIQPWADKVMQDSDGRIEIQIYPSMQLGGKPPQLFDQVRDGVADLVWTLPGYTRGRFPRTEVFELPFVAGSAEATSQAVMAFYDKWLKQEYEDVHPILLHTHAPGTFHMKTGPIRTLADLDGRKIRAPTRVINAALGAMGATPVGMPVPAVLELQNVGGQFAQALAKGVVDGTMLPYEVTLPLKVHELVEYHSEVGGDRGIYTSVFLFAMNKRSYDNLPADLRRVIDANSGLALAQRIGRVWDEAEKPGRAAAQKHGNRFNTIPESELADWKKLTQPVIDEWVTEMDSRGLPGRQMLQEARELVDRYSR